MPPCCRTCKLPIDTLVRDEARLCIYQVLLRCARCSHIVIYKSSGKPQPTEAQIALASAAVSSSRPYIGG